MTTQQARAVGITANIVIGLSALALFLATKHWVRR